MDPTMLEEIKQLLTIYGGGYKEHTERRCYGVNKRWLWCR